MSCRFLIGDVFERLAGLEPASVDLVVSSPPFLAVRNYLPGDHADKSKEIGSEPTPGAFIDRMLDVVEACDRVLSPYGSLVFELGDTYAGSGGAGGDYARGGMRDGQATFAGSARAGRTHAAGVAPPGERWRGRRQEWPLDKSKVLIPELFAVTLAYGFNPLTGRETEPWRVRNVVAWCRPNPPVGRDGDKFRPATSRLTVVTKARDRYWDGDAVRTEPSDTAQRYQQEPTTTTGRHEGFPGEMRPPYTNTGAHPAGAPLLDYWVIPTAPYAGAHYATYPPDLVVPLVKSMCPARVCSTCGQPSRRVTVTTNAVGHGVYRTAHRAGADGIDRPGAADVNVDAPDNADRVTTGWTICGHGTWRPGLVLDPFAGTATTLEVASGHGFDSIGIDIDERNAWLARERVGMFLDIEGEGW